MQYTGWTRNFSHWFVVKLYCLFGKTENKRKKKEIKREGGRAGDQPPFHIRAAYGAIAKAIQITADPIVFYFGLLALPNQQKILCTKNWLDLKGRSPDLWCRNRMPCSNLWGSKITIPRLPVLNCFLLSDRFRGNKAGTVPRSAVRF